MAAAGRVTSFEFECDGWVHGAARFRGDVLRATYRRFEDALDAAFDMTQRDVHIITGSLKLSGKKYITIFGMDDVGVGIEYGGDAPGAVNDPVDYAWFEMRRGGSHDFLTPAIVKHLDRFSQGMTASFEEVMSTWR